MSALGGQPGFRGGARPGAAARAAVRGEGWGRGRGLARPLGVVYRELRGGRRCGVAVRLPERLRNAAAPRCGAPLSGGRGWRAARGAVSAAKLEGALLAAAPQAPSSLRCPGLFSSLLFCEVKPDGATYEEMEPFCYVARLPFLSRPFLQGELHGRSDTGHHGQKGQHQEHVSDRPR